MPMRPARPCRTPQCPNLVDQGYCDACRQKLGLTDRQARTGSHWSDWNRGTSTERGYGAPWRRLRDEVLREAEHMCVPCRREGRLALAREVHHIIARADGGTDDKTNLEARCTDCHRRATAAMRRR